jgi:hypothetical protein
MIRLRQVVAQKLERGEVHLARLEQRVDDWKAVKESRRDYSSMSLTFAESELPHAKIEHRRKARFEVKAAMLDLRETRDELGGDGSMRADELSCVEHESVIGTLLRFHGFFDNTPIFGFVFDAQTRERQALQVDKCLARQSVSAAVSRFAMGQFRSERPTRRRPLPKPSRKIDTTCAFYRTVQTGYMGGEIDR